MILKSLRTTHVETLFQPPRGGKVKTFLGCLAGIRLEMHIGSDATGFELDNLRVTGGLTIPDSVVLCLALKLKTQLSTSDKPQAQAARELKAGDF